MKYKVGDYITSKDGKLEIKNSKERLIKSAKEEIKRLERFIKNLQTKK